MLQDDSHCCCTHRASCPISGRSELEVVAFHGYSRTVRFILIGIAAGVV